MSGNSGKVWRRKEGYGCGTKGLGRNEGLKIIVSFGGNSRL